MTDQTTNAPAAAGRSRGPASAGVIIGLLVISAFVMILNETIMSVALPHLVTDLHITATTAQWVTSGFLLTMAVVIPTTGFLLERFSPRQAYLLSMTLFSTGTLIAGLAPGFGVLLAGRIVQASGTAVMIPLLMTTIMTLVPAERRGRTMGTISIVIAVAPALGPTISGAILSSLGWRWMFLVVLPLALIALGLGAARMRVSSETRAVPLDVLSVLLSAVGFFGVVFGFSSIGETAQGGGIGVPPWIPLVIGAVFLAAFIVRQVRLQRRERALLNLRPFEHRPFVVAVVLAGLTFMALLGVAVLLPIYLQDVVGAGAFATGLAVLPGGLVLGLLGRPVGRLFDKFGARPLVVPGAVVMAIALWLLAAMGASASVAAVVAVHVLLSVGLAFMMTPLMTEALDVLPSGLYSHGSAIMATLQQVAGAAGTAAFIAVAALAADNPARATDAAGLRAAFMFAGCAAVLAVVVAFFVRGRKQRAADGTEPPRADTGDLAAVQGTPADPGDGPGSAEGLRAVTVPEETPAAER